MSQHRALLATCAMALSLSSCVAALPAVVPAAQQVVTLAAMEAAMVNALRLGKQLGPQAGPALHQSVDDFEVRHAPIDLLRRVPGAAMARAAITQVHDDGRVVFHFRDDRPWQGGDPHHEAIKVHEAVHALQDQDMSTPCAERQAYLIHAAYLLERSEPELAVEMATQADAQQCDSF